jgi:hypothetical protein
LNSIQHIYHLLTERSAHKGFQLHAEFSNSTRLKTYMKQHPNILMTKHLIRKTTTIVTEFTLDEITLQDEEE